MDNFTAFRIHQEEGSIRADFETMTVDQLSQGEVVVEVSYSGINYKDALAATGKGKILRKSPLVGGIDLAGSVIESSDPKIKTGDRVLVCGCGLSETRDGGYSQIARMSSDSVVRIPEGLSEREVMAIGTAGFTAGLAVQRMEDNGQNPDLGPIVVTGATGGVGSIAIDMFSGLGYEVIAYTGKRDQHEYLKTLGVSEFLLRGEVEMGTRPLEKATWGGAVDNVGGEVLNWLTRTVKPWGNIASIGLAGGYEISTTVMPFILRGVSLLGINSIEMPLAVRDEVWQRLAGDLKPRHLEQIITREIPFAELPNAFAGYMKGEVTGRTVVKIGG